MQEQLNSPPRVCMNKLSQVMDLVSSIIVTGKMGVHESRNFKSTAGKLEFTGLYTCTYYVVLVDQ